MHYVLVLAIAIFFLFGFQVQEAQKEADQKAQLAAIEKQKNKQPPPKVYPHLRPKKSTSELKKDADLAVVEKHIKYSFYTSTKVSETDYRVKLYIEKIPASGYARIISVFNGVIHNGGNRFKEGSSKPKETKKYPRTTRNRLVQGTNLTLYRGDSKYYFTRQEASNSFLEYYQYSQKTLQEIPAKNYDPYRKKSDSELRTDAEAATSVHTINYTYHTKKWLGNGEYKLQLFLEKIPASGYARIISVFSGIVHSPGGKYVDGSTKPTETKKYPRMKYTRYNDSASITLYRGDSKFYTSRAAAVNSRYEALKFRFQ